MAEYIGARISLVSKSDIRYLGTLHQINSADSTVALENVISMGTEGRKNGIDEKPANKDKVWPYIVFRGSDVKDLRIEEAPEEKAPPPAPVPDDPAILGSTRPPQAPAQNQPPQQQQPPFNQPPPYGQFPPYPPMHNQGFGRGGFPPGPGGPGFPGGPNFPGGQFGPPPGWYPPPGQGFPPGPGQFSPHHQQGPHGPPGPPGAPGQRPPQQNPAQQGGKGPQQAPIGPGAAKEAKSEEKKPEAAASKAPEATAVPKKAPTPPIESKPDVAAAVAPPAPVTAPISNGPKGPKGRVAPVIPRQPPVARAPAPTAAASQPAATPAQAYQNATQAATAAVAAAMAKLPMAGKVPGSAPAGDASVDNLTKKVQEMRTDNNIRHSTQPGTGGFVAGNRGGRGGGHRGGRREHPAPKPVEVPTTDYDFAEANAKFNKQDLVKETIATGSPLVTSAVPEMENSTDGPKPEEKASEDVVIPPAQQAYDKKSSFFDNISSELKDRDETKRGMEFRSEERKKNMETFGQGSVDNYRGGYRGRGRGRGGYRGGRGRGFANAGNGYPARGGGGGGSGP